MTTDNFCFHLQNRLIQTSQTGGQQYSDTSPFSIPWISTLAYYDNGVNYGCEKFYSIGQRKKWLYFVALNWSRLDEEEVESDKKIVKI